MARIVPKNARITPGGYGSTSATKRKQRADGGKSPRKTKKSKKSKKSKKKQTKRRAIQALTEYQGREFHWKSRDGTPTWTEKLKAPIDRTDNLFLLTDAGCGHDFIGKNPDDRTPPLT